MNESIDNADDEDNYLGRCGEMNGTELISFITNNFSTIMTPVEVIASSLFTAFFLRHNIATKEFEKVKAGLFKEAAEDLLNSGVMTYAEFYKVKNFFRVAQLADEYYSQKAFGKGNASYEFDWFVRFYEAVGVISDEKMQEMWAKVLAREVNNPGGFSLRSMEILRNLGKEAMLFDKISKYVLNAFDENNSVTDYFLVSYDKALKCIGLTFPDLLSLVDANLLILNVSTVTIGFKVKPGEIKKVYIGDSVAFVIENNTDSIIDATKPAMLLTEAGREIYEIIYKDAVSDSADGSKNSYYYQACKEYLCM